jgi:hypothetical protein
MARTLWLMHQYIDTYFQFTSAHIFLGTILGLSAISATYSFCVYPLKLINRWIRHLNIKAAGWPPPGVDADGDAVETKLES